MFPDCILKNRFTSWFVGPSLTGGGKGFTNGVWCCSLTGLVYFVFVEFVCGLFVLRHKKL